MRMFVTFSRGSNMFANYQKSWKGVHRQIRGREVRGTARGGFEHACRRPWLPCHEPSHQSDSGLSPKCKEVAILVAAAKDKSAYEVYAHTVLGENRGITPEEIESIMQIERSQTFNDEEKTVYDVARELVSGEGPLPKPARDKAVELLGKDGSTALVHLVGFYSYVCVLLRGVDCQVPDEDDQKSQ